MHKWIDWLIDLYLTVLTKVFSSLWKAASSHWSLSSAHWFNASASGSFSFSSVPSAEQTPWRHITESKNTENQKIRPISEIKQKIKIFFLKNLVTINFLKINNSPQSFFNDLDWTESECELSFIKNRRINEYMTISGIIFLQKISISLISSISDRILIIWAKSSALKYDVVNRKISIIWVLKINQSWCHVNCSVDLNVLFYDNYNKCKYLRMTIKSR